MPIRVLIVDDSPMFRGVVRRALSVDTDIEVVREVEDAFVASEPISELQPDVSTLDVEMPKMSGIEFLR